jgi:hypothetical protein
MELPSGPAEIPIIAGAAIMLSAGNQLANQTMR